MSLLLSNNCVLQTGNWDEPQIISFDSLFENYTIEKVFQNEEVERIIPVVNRWKELAKDHFSKESKERTMIAKYIEANPKITRRTAHVELEETPNIIYKTYFPNSSELHPMATTFRTPMASLIAETIVNNNLSDLGVPKKALIPLFSKEEISHLDEKTINEAFINCVEKINALDPKETREKIKALPEAEQERLADQICTVLMKTGLGDCTWENLQMHQSNGKLYFLDTEVFEFELFIDKFDEGFEQCSKLFKRSPLKRSAKIALELFKVSSMIHRLDVFKKKAQTLFETTNFK